MTRRRETFRQACLAKATSSKPAILLLVAIFTQLPQVGGVVGEGLMRWFVVLAGFEEARRLGGDFCLATHYWEIDDHMAAVLRTVVEHAERAGAQFVPADALFERS